MAKKLNKTVVVILVTLLVLMIGGLGGLFVLKKLRHNPDKALAKARQFLEAGDYKSAQREFGNAFAYGKTDEYKIERLFELAEFHLINNADHEVNWTEALKCWNTVINIDTNNVEARRKLLDFYYQGAEAGSVSWWKSVKDNTDELLATLKAQGTQPDSTLLTAHAKALLMIAARGETTNRQELLNESIRTLETLIDKEPDNEELYSLMADTAFVQGELDKLSGVMKAKEKAREKAREWLNTGIEKASNKALATANLLEFQYRYTFTDPNSVTALRADIESRSKVLPPSDKILSVLSKAYEQTGTMAPETELNYAIEAIRQAHELAPENVEYVIRMAQLLYRKGSAFNDPAALADSIQLAEEGLTMEQSKDIPGPLRGRNLQYRYTLNTFLANVCLVKAYEARQNNDPSLDAWTQKADSRIQEITSYIGSGDNPIVRKFEGMLELARGNEDKALRLMYQAYEQMKALDQTDTRSGVDPLLCVTLADIMKKKGQYGMQKEFLEKALANQRSYALQKPDMLLEYAELLARGGNWQLALVVTQGYQQRYGASERGRQILIRAFTSLSQYDKAQESLSEMDPAAAVTKDLQLNLLNYQILTARQQIDQLTANQQEPTDEQTQELETLRQKRNPLLDSMLKTNSDAVDEQNLVMACYDLWTNGKNDIALDYLKRYVQSHPDSISTKTMYLRATEPTPLDVSGERMQEIRKQVLNEIADPKMKALQLTQFYRNQGEFEKAIEQLDTVTEKDPDILITRFEIALEMDNTALAEELLSQIRKDNADQTTGLVSSARVEYAKKNYSLALRRLDECITAYPLNSLAYLLKSQVYLQQDDLESAIENAKTARSMNPQNPVYVRNLASVLLARNTRLGSKVTPQQTAEAELALRFAIQLNPGDQQLRSVFAETLSERSPDQALMIRRQLLENNPTVLNALMLGNMAMRLAGNEWDDAKRSGLYELAGKAYRQAADIDPQNETVRQALADYYRIMGNPDEAIKLIQNDENMLWKYYLRSSQFEQAREILEKLHQQKPDDELVLRGLISAIQGIGDRPAVLPFLQALEKLNPPKETELWILQKYLDNGFADDAAKLLASFKERYPDEPTALLIEAWTEMGQGRLQNAMELTNRYLETNTENPGAWRLRGRLYRLMNQPRKAIDDFQRSKTIQPDPMVRLELATVYHETGQSTAAIGELTQALNDPQVPIQIRLMLERIYLQNKLYSELEKFYQSTLEKYPQSVFWYLHAGQYYLNRENYPQARLMLSEAWSLSMEQQRPNAETLNAYLNSLYLDKQYEQAFKVASELIDSPLAPVAYAYMALVQVQMNQKDKAIESFSKSLEKADLNDAFQQNTLSKMLNSVGEQEVVRWYETQLAQNPESLPAHVLAYNLAMQQQQYNNAIKHIDQSIDIAGQDPQGWMYFAIKKLNALIAAYTKTLDADYLNRALTLSEKILEKQPDNPTILNNTAYLLADNDQNLEKALEYARKAQQASPGNAIFLDTYAYVLCKLNQYDKAEQNLLRSIQIYEASSQPLPWDLYKHLGMIKEGLGKKEEALEAYKNAVNSSQEIPDKEKVKIEKSIDRLLQM